MHGPGDVLQGFVRALNVSLYLSGNIEQSIDADVDSFAGFRRKKKNAAVK